MKIAWQQFTRFIYPDCSTVTRDSADHVDGEMNWSKLMGGMLHRSCCRSCRRAHRQMGLLKVIVASNFDVQTQLVPAALSNEARARLKAELRKATGL